MLHGRGRPASGALRGCSAQALELVFLQLARDTYMRGCEHAYMYTLVVVVVNSMPGLRICVPKQLPVYSERLYDGAMETKST